MLTTVTERYADCIIYSAIKADDGLANLDTLIESGQKNCVVNRGMWKFFSTYATEIETLEAEDGDPILKMAERDLTEQVRVYLNGFLDAGRRAHQNSIEKTESAVSPND